MKPQIYLLLIGFLFVLGCTDEEEENTPEQKAPAFVGSWIAEKVSIDGTNRDEFENIRWTFETDSLHYQGHYYLKNLPDIEENQLEDIAHGNWWIDPNVEDLYMIHTDPLSTINDQSGYFSINLHNDQLTISFKLDPILSNCENYDSVPCIIAPFSYWNIILNRDESNGQ